MVLNKTLILILPFLISFGIPVIIAFGFFHWVRFKRQGKRSPLKGSLLRSPGESLLNKIEEFDDKINDKIIFIFLIPLVLYSSYISQLYFGATKFNILVAAIIVIISIIFFILTARQMIQLIQVRHDYRLGYEAEMAVGQELSQLMLEGYHVFHDFPEEHNNIDHVVVGPSGVFAVETKGRAKPDKSRGTVDATVSYDGRNLIFPDNIVTSEPIEQAKKQAATLSKFISSATGEKIFVKPALALPGWFIKREKADDFILLYGRKNEYLKAVQGNEVLNREQIGRIVHQLDSKCRDVKLQTYNPNK